MKNYDDLLNPPNEWEDDNPERTECYRCELHYDFWEMEEHTGHLYCTDCAALVRAEEAEEDARCAAAEEALVPKFGELFSQMATDLVLQTI